MLSLSRAPRALLVGLAFAGLVAFAPVASAATFWRAAPEARIAAIYHDTASAGFDADSRLGDGVSGGQAITDQVRVIIDTGDERLGDGADSVVTLSLDPHSLTTAQNEALNSHRGGLRLAAFHLNAKRVSHKTHGIDYARSEFCGADELRCEDHVVYKDDVVEDAVFTIDA